MIQNLAKLKLRFQGPPMTKQRVILDALIQREDLEINSENPEKPGGDVPRITLVELEHDRSMFEVLRKPDFQRETSEWSPEQIVELVKNVLDEELVPAVIVWKAASRNVFVIDGAHRLSALIAWVNDDYGAGSISLKFYGGIDGIPKDQRAAAKVTKELIESTIGSYSDLNKFRRDGTGATPEQIRRAKGMATASIFAQSVRNDAEHAEASFYRINQGGAVINDTEKEIILARRKPVGLAARALLRAGTGHAYWWKCSTETKTKIVTRASEIHKILYKPEENSDGYNSIPVAGKAFSSDALAFLFEIIHVANDLKREKKKNGKRQPSSANEDIPDKDPEASGLKAVEYLEKILDLTRTIFSKQSKSLGLHPAVYCRTATGKFQPAAYLAQIELIKYLNRESDGFHKFTAVRQQFEEFLVENKSYVNQIVRGLGAGIRSLPTIFEMYLLIYRGFKDNLGKEAIKNAILSDPTIGDYVAAPTTGKRDSGGEFKTAAKAAAKMRTELETAKPCPECKARLHMLAATLDHDNRKEDGGSAHSDNGEWMHPFCNSGVKERRLHRATSSI